VNVTIGSLCTGYGGLDHATLAAFGGGGRIAWVADPDPHVSTHLAARQPEAPNLGDIRAVDWTNIQPVEVLTAGFPCQDISAAGRRAGIQHGTRSGLFYEVVRAIKTLHPTWVVIENVAALRWRGGGLDVVLAELHHADYDCLWTSIRASDIGAAHRRERVFLLAWPRETTAGASFAPAPTAVPVLTRPSLHAATEDMFNTEVAWGPYEAAIRRWELALGRPAPHPVEAGRGGRPRLAARFVEWLMGLDDGHVTGVDLELPRTAQLRILGNGVVPQQAHAAVCILLDRLSRIEQRQASARAA